MSQLPPHQIQKGRIGGDATRHLVRHLQRHVLATGILGADQVLFDHDIQYQGTAFLSAVRMAARVVARGSMIRPTSRAI